jgi:hypothetical protein
MANYPFFYLIFPAVALGYVLFMRSQHKKKTQEYDEQYANFRAGQLAQRLGLQLLKGDPAFNFMVTYANQAVARGATDDKAINIDIEMAGTPFGVPLGFRYLYRVERESGFNSTTYKTWFNCRMSASAKLAFPPFEVTSRNTSLGRIVREQALPEAPTHNPAVDAEFLVATHEPALAQLLGQLLPEFSMFGAAGVHLTGDGQQVSFVMNLSTAPMVPSALYYAEVMTHALSTAAQRLGG